MQDTIFIICDALNIKRKRKAARQRLPPRGERKKVWGVWGVWGVWEVWEVWGVWGVWRVIFWILS
ncbi:hypothetical protein VF14_04580 [Nostoc linckia z18]|uniref:Uncharacterized protein n=2 Tax=Nostoc linckia TaxID=92942 RepID=A0A9Q6EK49_NOSLI|nr:hypothetical protein [Nostoc linckia]PHK42609.1 hypothetical protein VF12_02135 [Nostoc linckia z15]PHK48008.1 hypothetical protein VF13_02595 [Nostoc linckia z16]PHJ61076.1 hypothetical protein VF05_29135 [Nostoc linckia z3]PHJ64779.1 hypothetical protein VF02_12230 [Nostoc linckia z1]PHJ70982.1 hypothetical protein VF03_20980 [Nostoc linckia z2]